MEAKDMTLTEFDELIGESFKVKQEIEDFEKTVLDPLKDRLKTIDNKILAHLEKADLSSFKSKYGTVIRSKKFSVQTPKTTDQKAAFFQWLKDKGDEVYWQYVTVNSQSLNSLYKEEMDIAKEEGNIDFVIPGILEPTYYEQLSKRKK